MTWFGQAAAATLLESHLCDLAKVWTVEKDVQTSKARIHIIVNIAYIFFQELANPVKRINSFKVLLRQLSLRERA